MASINALYKKKEELITEVMRLWRLNALEYRLLPIKYKYLLAMREYARNHVPEYRDLRLGRIPKRKLDDYPEIEFFRIVDEDSAKEFLEWSTYGEILSIKASIEAYCRLSYAKSTLEAKVADYSFWWRNIDAPKNDVISPDSCRRGKHTTNYGKSCSSRDEFSL